MPVARLADGKCIWYRDEGAGEPFLQVHGTALGHRNFDRITPVLARHVRCLDPDLVGFGESSPLPAEGYTLEAWADDLARLLDALGLERVHVHGTSTGGSVALVFALRHPSGWASSSSGAPRRAWTVRRASTAATTSEW